MIVLTLAISHGDIQYTIHIHKTLLLRTYV